MVFLYAAVLLAFAVMFLINRNYQKGTFEGLNKKEHPLFVLYPLSAKFVDFLTKILPKKNTANLEHYMKSLYVKENIAAEKYLFQVKKASIIILILIASSFLGLITCLIQEGPVKVENLQRNDYGEGKAYYELSAQYKGNEENVNISIDEILFTDDEILGIFDEAFDDVVIEMLAENESQERVSKTINLITSYMGFDIYWEIDDIKAVNYNGEILEKQEEGESKLVNLSAIFSMGNVQKKYSVPIVIVAPDMSEQEMLVKLIRENIEENEDKYSSEVKLPRAINGERISFRTISESNGALFLILGILAVLAIFFLYDRTLEKQVEKRKEEMILDFSEIVSKLSLLYNAGLSIYGAWERIVEDYEKSLSKERFAYKEMKLVIEKVKSGMSEGLAYEQFGKRCGLHQYIKLGNLLEQNLNKGSKGMKLLLMQEVESSMEERKRTARKKGEEASTKMLIPMVIMLVIVIVIVSVPALMSMKL